MDEYKNDSPPIPEGVDKKMETPEERRKRKALADHLRNPVLEEPMPPPQKPRKAWA
jgi:hypothetical protein